jgi:hypothetical protein
VFRIHEAAEGRVRVRMVEDVERVVAIVEDELERTAGPRVDDRDAHDVARCVPEERDLETVRRAMIEFPAGALCGVGSRKRHASRVTPRVRGSRPADRCLVVR